MAFSDIFVWLKARFKLEYDSFYILYKKIGAE